MMGGVTRRKRKRIWINQFSEIRLVSMCDKYRSIKKQCIMVFVAMKPPRVYMHECTCLLRTLYLYEKL